VLAGLAELPLLALDDLGTENPTAWTRERLYTLVNRRYLARRSTMVTANERPAALARQLGQRIMSWLRGTSVEAHLSGVDYRLARREHVLDELRVGWAEQWARSR
jgi:DNA replication protein DnaC